MYSYNIITGEGILYGMYFGSIQLKSIFSLIFQQKISANRLALVGMADGWAAFTIRLKFWLKFCFLTITQMFLNGID